MAQTPAPASTNHSPAALNAPSARDTSVSATGGMRASQLVGSSVYNDHNEKIGRIDDLIIGSSQTLAVVVSVGGFLGLGSKMVGVPFDKLQFSTISDSSDSRVVMPGASKHSLIEMPAYQYDNRG
jgi:sporulation protein YlmC with PRC-barrel domain